ncbi:autotransporter domain-containing protein [Novosphingobium sp.]|uniref:autotransporter domain-containing protein n=1 Tax=Novosphingobium sp. TaxID=1874826 RepID=UPI00258C75A4|nr:autotransporter domain-containing protein [Novosphingobium sp.]
MKIRRPAIQQLALEAGRIALFSAPCAVLSMPAPAFAQSAGITGDAAIAGRPAQLLGVGFEDLSGDGNTIAATVRMDATTYRAYRVTATGFEALPGVSGDAYVLARGVSDNGSVIVGSSAATFSSRGSAVVWGGTTLTVLDHLSSAAATQNSVAYAVSGNGRVIVGASAATGGGLRAVRWTDKGAPQDLQGTANFSSSSARSTSRDGSVIVGEANSTRLANEAFVWTAEGGMVGLGVLPGDAGGAFPASFAADVSADGSTVVGFSKGGNGDNSQAIKWTRAGGMTGLGFLPSGQSSRALGVNADGSVIVGYSTRPSSVVPSIQDTVAVRWTASGIQTIADWLSANSVAVGSNTFTEATAVSDDGRVVIGEGQINGTTQQFIARIVAPASDGTTDGGSTGGGSTGGGTTDGGSSGGTTDGSTGGSTDGSAGGGSTGGGGFIGMLDYLQSVSQSGGVTFQNVINAASVTLFGAHHRPLTDFAQDGRTCAWATGDIAGSSRNNRRNYSAELGLCHDFGETVRVGIGGGADRTELDLALGGRTVMDGWHMVGEIDVKPANGPVGLSVLGYYGDWRVNIDRAYANAATIDHSRGRTKARVWAVRGRIDWQDALSLGEGAGISPYLAYTHLDASMDGYTETGGGFPLTLGKTGARLDETRLGAAAAFRLGKMTRLRAAGEWVHRFGEARPALAGTIIGVGAFATVAPGQQRDWGRLGLDLDFALGRGVLLNLSGHVMAGQGEDARAGGSVSLRIAF